MASPKAASTMRPAITDMSAMNQGAEYSGAVVVVVPPAVIEEYLYKSPKYT